MRKGSAPARGLAKGVLMDLVILVLILALVGFLVWALTTYIPMPPGWAQAIQIGALIVLVLYLIARFAGGLPNVLPR